MGDRTSSVQESKSDVRARSGHDQPTTTRPDAASTSAAEMVRAELLVAQHWLDTGTTRLEHDRGRNAQRDQETIREVEYHASRHLELVHKTVTDLQTNIGATKLVEQVDRTSRALDLFVTATIEHAPNANKLDRGRLLEMDSGIRNALQLSHTPRRGPHVKASNSNDTYERQAIGPTLDFLTVKAKEFLAELRASSQTNRDSVVLRASQTLSRVDHVAFLIDEYDGKDAKTAFASKIDAFSSTVLAIATWIDKKQDRATMTSFFHSVVSETDSLRQRVGLKPLDQSDFQVRTTRNETNGDEAEKADVLHAQTELHLAIQTARAGVGIGMNRFLEFAKFERLSPPGSIWGELIKGILIAVVGNVIGPGVGALFSRVTKVSEDLAQGSATDIVQSVLGTATQQAADAVAAMHASIRERQLFSEVLVTAYANATEMLERSVNDRIHEASISAGEIGRLLAEVNKTKARMADITFMEASQGYALYKARAGLGTTEGAGKKQVTQIGTEDEYFGTPTHDLPRRIGAPPLPPVPMGRTGGKSGTIGVAKLTVSIDGGRIAMDEFQIHGINGDLARGVLARAMYQPGSLGIPLEIEFDVADVAGMLVAKDWIKTQETPMLVVDELGVVRTSRAWDVFSDVRSAYSRLMLATPQQAWLEIKRSSIPSTIRTVG
jgi:hypothetical protein